MYSELQAWHGEFGAGVEILLFPSDEFGGQEIAADKITPFVQKTFALPADEPGLHILAKSNVNGPTAHPIWALAKKAFPGEVQAQLV